MSRIDARTRAELPNSAFAHVDSSGHRRLPIHDEAHVRNALARFNRTTFEDEAARDLARTRLLKAAKKYGIVPIGFMTGQLRNVRIRGEVEARVNEVRTLPTGFVTFLLADIEDSTGLVRLLGDRYGELLADVRALLGAAVLRCGGREVDTRADELFAVFKQSHSALDAAMAIQRQILARAWLEHARVRVRIGLHTGRPTLTDTGYVGLAVNVAARICYAAHGGQIVLSQAARDSVQGSAPVLFRELGSFTLRGLPGPEALFQAMVEGLPNEFPRPRTDESLSTSEGGPGRTRGLS